MKRDLASLALVSCAKLREWKYPLSGLHNSLLTLWIAPGRNNAARGHGIRFFAFLARRQRSMNSVDRHKPRPSCNCNFSIEPNRIMQESYFWASIISFRNVTEIWTWRTQLWEILNLYIRNNEIFIFKLRRKYFVSMLDSFSEQ